ncbi:MAG: class I SAM-dependent methyltransferase [candidate division Zixibacteria bacterium]|nr:class I SAM-dependent methyltransferase [candidate division Zixibacteria bacterium]
MSNLYDNPKYYEIAFSFRNILSEVDLIEECFKRFSQISVRSVLELGCGISPHMEELIKRGYRYNGLDLNKVMLEYSRQKALKIGAEVTLFQEDMIDFSLERMVDFVYILLGSLSLKNTADLITHFNSVARVLKKGGLYLLDWCVQFELPRQAEEGDSWEMERDGIQVKTEFSRKTINRAEQTFEETITLEVDDHGKKLNLIEKCLKKAIYPQEFLCFISSLKGFEFVGWWNNWDLSQPLEKADKISRPIVLVRRI